ncbi:MULTISPECIES: AEC family transporter [Rhodomicrobium]|uniref:AEC family transporter n=1 Tax=Rhodomicrobium TaxID=1068 RepID=UPI0014831318|nr:MULTISPECIES: AEC family transporter [Rhodomicrobium]
MQLFLDILTGITLPILGLVGLGYGVQRRLGFDVPTLTRMQVYVLLPGALIYFPSAAKLPLDAAWPILWFSLLHFAFLFALGWGIAALAGMNRNLCAILGLAAFFSNSGNYGIPLIQLTFPEDYLLYQTVVLSLHSIVIAPVALLTFRSPENSGRNGILKAFFGTPLLPAAALGYLLKGYDVVLPTVLAVPLKLVSDAFTPMALLLLGVQLAAIEGKVERGPLLLGLVLRLAIAPATAWGFALLLGFPPNLIAFFVVSAAVPVGVLLAIFASEYKVEPGLASMMVFISTVLSALAVTGWVYAVRYAGLQ